MIKQAITCDYDECKTEIERYRSDLPLGWVSVVFEPEDSFIFCSVTCLYNYLAKYEVDTKRLWNLADQQFIEKALNEVDDDIITDVIISLSNRDQSYKGVGALLSKIYSLKQQ